MASSRHRFEVDGETQTVLVGDAEGLTTVTIDDAEPIVADATLSGVPGMISLVIDGQPSRAYVAREGRNFRVTVEGRTFLIAAAGGGKRDRGGVGAVSDPPGSITAPIAGVFVEAHVAVGDAVEAGQSVFVVEAMKMQNEIQAPLAGTVTAIHFGPGDRVEKGDLIVEYDVAEE